MRILIKGGVWKNTEDEILKAAVMKYGLNQWGRISSLLVRKSAKQCKARWYEWLDPAIKKTEWTREEDEKLLHLAKLMPTQWRTIAPIVGRTPTQCLERYEKLLDMAAGKEGGYDPRDDPRRLRPGEIDPHPETKPARPDPVDMDEDEKEMLSEARARLANTKGKKAKRKAREKQLEEARRLASLQKKRELKAAGIEVREKVRKGKGVDYAREVPFEHRPAPGFYDVEQEEHMTREMREEFRPVTKEELEGQKRTDIEAELVKRDIQRQKMAERQNAPAAVARAVAMNEAQAVRRRGKMMLPTPQVSEAELEMLAQAGSAAMDIDGLAEGGSDATRSLIGDYATPARFATPMRTPATSQGMPGGVTSGKRLMQEAENLARLQSGQTPLLGGDNPHLHPSDFSGITPRNEIAATPNPLAGARPTQGHSAQRAIAGIGATPLPHQMGSTPLGAAMPPGATPMRDALGLNTESSALEVVSGAATSRREEAMRAALTRNVVRAGLGQLPAPKNDYQIALPELTADGVDGEAEDEDAMHVEDAAERDIRRKNAAHAAAEAELRRQTQAIQRGLPRPVALDLVSAARPEPELASLNSTELAEELVQRELLILLQHDSARYPLEKHKGPASTSGSMVSPLERFEENELHAASEALQAEVTAVRRAMGHSDTALEEYIGAWEAVSSDIIFVPSQQRYTRAAALPLAERVAAMQAEFEGLRKDMEREAKRAGKLEQKAGLVTGGLVARQDRLRSEVEEGIKSAAAVKVEIACYKVLHEQEQRVAPERIEALQALVSAASAKEAALQARYREALLRRAALQKAAATAAT